MEFNIRDQYNIDRINYMVATNTSLTQSDIAEILACSYDDDALKIMFILFELEIADAFLMVYDKDNNLVHKRNFMQGFPDSSDEYLYGFSIDIVENPPILLASMFKGASNE